MRLATLFGLVLLALAVLEANASEDANSYDTDASELSIPVDVAVEEEEEHERFKRSPGWRRRFRVRVRRPFRKVAQSVRRVASKVGQSFRRATSKLKTGLKKAASKVKAAAKKVTGKFKSAWKKAQDKTKSALRKVKDKVKGIGKFPEKLAKNIKDKLKAKILRGFSKGKGNEETPVEESCDADCKFLRKSLQVVQLFKKSFCAFYTVKRKHSDFMLDRNQNATLALVINDILLDSLSFYTELSNAVRLFDPSWKTETRQALSASCNSGGVISCAFRPASSGAFDKLKCLEPCRGFTSCKSSDRKLVQAIDRAAKEFLHEVNQALKLLS